MTYDEIAAVAKECGFTHFAPLDMKSIELKPEVRDMCAAGKCSAYGRSWVCPPGCGTLEECKAKLDEYKHGILLQTVGDIEDSLDGEGMMKAGSDHHVSIDKMQDKLDAMGVDILTLSSGTCRRCKECTYPDAPCRMPNRKHSSMEAYGMLVLEVCKKNNLDYYYGPNHIAYTGCIFYK